MYTSESIITALKANEKLSCEGIDSIGCPSPIPHEGCKGAPETCKVCIEQSCKQPVSIHLNYKKMTVLTFKFMVSPKDRGGFIRKDDSALDRLIRHNLIDINLLKLVV